MKVSVIIPTYNEEDVISKCLESLNKQTYTDFEVIVVDDGSSDGTSLKLRATSDKLDFRLTVMEQKHEGAGAGRNLGAKQAEGEILVFVDSDMTFDKHFLKMLIKPITASRSKGTFSKDEYVSNWDKPLARYYNLNEGWEKKKRHPKNYPNTQKVFRAILKSEFDQVGGFTPGGYNDDWSLSEKLGYEATLAPKAIFYHKNPDNLKEIFNHAVWVGKRKYKYGYLGFLVGIVRVSLPISMIIGLIKGVMIYDLMFVIFKIIYDFGVFVGILKYIFKNSGSK